MRTVLTAYPNNEFRLRVIPSGRISPWVKADSWVAESGSDVMSGPDCSLDITSDFETRGKLGNPGWGVLGRKTVFGRYGKNMLLRAGGALEKEGFKPSDTVFLTGTLPGSTDEAFRAMAEWSSFAIHRLKALVNKHVPSKLDFYVWELQRRGALHLHYAVVVPSPDKRQFILASFKRWWAAILDEISERSGVDVWGRAEGGSWNEDKSVLQAYAQEVRKGVGQYLAKYCSKNSSKGNADAYYPVRWWGISRPMQALIKKHTVEIEVYDSSLQRCKEQFLDLWETLKSFACKGFRYAHDKGSGLFAVLYCNPKKWIDIIEEVKRDLTGTKNMYSNEFVYRSKNLRRQFQVLASQPKNWAVIGANLSEGKLQTLVTWLTCGYSDEWQVFEAVQDAAWQVWDYCHTRGIMFTWAKEFNQAALLYLRCLQRESLAVRAVLEQYPSLEVTDYMIARYTSVASSVKTL